MIVTLQLIWNICWMGFLSKTFVGSEVAFISKAMDNLFPMKGKKWEYSLTDVLLFAILVCVLSMGHHSSRAASGQSLSQHL